MKDSDPISYCFPDRANLEKCFFQVDGSLQNLPDRFVSTFSDPASLNDFLNSFFLIQQLPVLNFCIGMSPLDMKLEQFSTPV